MSPEARENMIMGQKAARAVDAYLTYMTQGENRGRKVNKGALEQKIAEESNLAHKVILIAQMHELIRQEEEAAKGQQLEDEFLKYVNWFSEQHNVTPTVWREMNVPLKVLKKAGLA